MSERKVFYDIDGKEEIDESAAIIELLEAEVLFPNSRKYVDIPWPPGAPEKDTPDIKDATIVLFVNCNDLFYWACGDAESLPMSELTRLYKLWKQYPKHGSDMWVCLRRNMRPQWCLMQMMMKEGVWTPEMESLPARDDEGSMGNPVIEKYRFNPQPSTAPQ